MHILALGELFAAGITRWPESIHYNWDPVGHAPAPHHALTVLAERPATDELRAFRRGTPLELALLVDAPAIVLLWRGGGWPWSDAPFAWHLLPPERQVLPDTEIPDTAGVPLGMVLVDAATGRVAGLRQVAMPALFARALHQAIWDQAQAPWDQAAYDARVAELAAVPCEELVARATARCRVGGAP